MQNRARGRSARLCRSTSRPRIISNRNDPCRCSAVGTQLRRRECKGAFAVWELRVSFAIRPVNLRSRLRKTENRALLTRSVLSLFGRIIAGEIIDVIKNIAKSLKDLNRPKKRGSFPFSSYRWHIFQQYEMKVSASTWNDGESIRVQGTRPIASHSSRILHDWELLAEQHAEQHATLPRWFLDLSPIKRTKKRSHWSLLQTHLEGLPAMLWCARVWVYAKTHARG